VSDGRDPGHEWSWDDPLRLPDVKETFETILVPVDGSFHSERGLAYASVLASMSGARVVVVVAYDPHVTVRRRGILAVQEARADMEADAKELANEAVQLMTDRGRSASAVVVRGDPVEAILQTADDENVDVIVMGRRGLSRLKGLLLGSVSERVARHAEIPVLLTS
jgi:nucleotide-binding universal stress UspA family protein